jgi:hypothetical protein
LAEEVVSLAENVVSLAEDVVLEETSVGVEDAFTDEPSGVEAVVALVDRVSLVEDPI